MNAMLGGMALACGLALASSGWAEVTFYEREDFRGRSFSVVEPVGNFSHFGFNDRASSAVVRSGSYLVCDDAAFRGRCVTLGPGKYRSPSAMGLSDRVSSARPTGSRGDGPRAVLFSRPNFGGTRVVLEGPNAARNFSGSGFNNTASSLRVEQGHWMLCSGEDFTGECRTFGPGDYRHLPDELGNRVSSARPVPEHSGRRVLREPRERDRD